MTILLTLFLAFLATAHAQHHGPDYFEPCPARPSWVGISAEAVLADAGVKAAIAKARPP